MDFKKIGKSIVWYLSVPKCVGCKTRLNREEDTLCEKCLTKYEDVKLRNCSVCSRPLNICGCSNEYLDRHYVHKLIKVFRYIHRDPLPSNNLIYSLKKDNRRDVLSFLTRELSSSISNQIKDFNSVVFTNVPRRRKPTVKYGIDHAALLAKSLAKHFSAEYYLPFVSKSLKAQKKMSGRERAENAVFEIKRHARDFNGKTVIIVDDIVTTGSSMGAVAMLVKSLGAKKIIGAAVSVAYKDSHKQFSIFDRFNTKQ